MPKPSSIAADDERPALGGRVEAITPRRPVRPQAGRLERPGRADDVVEPRACLRARRVQIEPVALAGIEPDELDPAIVGRQVGDADLEVDGGRQHEALVVVGVLADEVDPARGADDDGPRLAARRADGSASTRASTSVSGSNARSSDGVGPPASATWRRMAASSARSGRPVWSPSAAADGGTASVGHLERLADVRTVEPGGDEPGTERVAGPDRVDHHGEWHGRPGDRVVRRRRERRRATPSEPSLATTTAGPSARHARASDRRGRRRAVRGRRRRARRGCPGGRPRVAASSRRTGAAASSDQRRRRRLRSRLIVSPESRASLAMRPLAAWASADRAGVMPVRWSQRAPSNRPASTARSTSPAVSREPADPLRV